MKDGAEDEDDYDDDYDREDREISFAEVNNSSKYNQSFKIKSGSGSLFFFRLIGSRIKILCSLFDGADTVAGYPPVYLIQYPVPT